MKRYLRSVKVFRKEDGRLYADFERVGLPADKQYIFNRVRPLTAKNYWRIGRAQTNAYAENRVADGGIVIFFDTLKREIQRIVVREVRTPGEWRVEARVVRAQKPTRVYKLTPERFKQLLRLSKLQKKEHGWSWVKIEKPRVKWCSGCTLRGHHPVLAWRKVRHYDHNDEMWRTRLLCDTHIEATLFDNTDDEVKALEEYNFEFYGYAYEKKGWVDPYEE